MFSDCLQCEDEPLSFALSGEDAQQTRSRRALQEGGFFFLFLSASKVASHSLTHSYVPLC